MVTNQQARALALTGLQLTTLATTLVGVSAHATTSATAHQAKSEQASAMAQINTGSLASIESTWLQVPNACKARGFNAEPVISTEEGPNAAILALYEA